MERDGTTVVKWMRRAKERRERERVGRIARGESGGRGRNTKSKLVYSANGRGTDGEKERGRGMAGR